MTTFLDGPAKGQHLLLRLCPETLRVVVDSKGKWDALDMPEDEPRHGETVHTYKLEKRLGMCHINRGRKGGGFYAIAEYRWVP